MCAVYAYNEKIYFVMEYLVFRMIVTFPLYAIDARKLGNKTYAKIAFKIIEELWL